MKVLVVDDSRISRIKVIQLLTKLGHETTIEAKDGQEAVEKYKEFQPDIILSDYEMPVMNGIEMAKKNLRNKQKCHYYYCNFING